MSDNLITSLRAHAAVCRQFAGRPDGTLACAALLERAADALEANRTSGSTATEEPANE